MLDIVLVVCVGVGGLFYHVSLMASWGTSLHFPLSVGQINATWHKVGSDLFFLLLLFNFLAMDKLNSPHPDQPHHPPRLLQALTIKGAV